MRRIFVTILLLISITCSGALDILNIVRGDGRWKPFEWEEEGELKGIHIDLVTEAAKRAGIQIQIKSQPFIRSITDLKNGNADACLFMSYTKERELYAIFDSRNIISEVRFSFVSKKESSFKFIGDYNQIKEKKVGVVRGFSYGPDFQKNRDSLNLIYTKDNETLIKLIHSDRIDAFIVSVDYFVYSYGDSPGIDELTFSEPYFDVSPIYIAFNRDEVEPRVFQKFSNAMDEIKKSQFYQDTLKKYGLIVE